MLSTLIDASVLPDSVPARDAALMQRLQEEIDLLHDDASGTLYRFAIANDAGELYRTVLVFGFQKRNRVLRVLREMGYRESGSRPDRQLDAVFLPAEASGAQ